MAENGEKAAEGGGGVGAGEGEEQEVEESVKLFVGQVPKHMTEPELLAMFREVAAVDEVTVIKDKATRASRGACADPVRACVRAPPGSGGCCSSPRAGECFRLCGGRGGQCRARNSSSNRCSSSPSRQKAFACSVELLFVLFFA